ncbi:MAG: hypothetical protein LBB91_12330 [Clostridiales bacterium]|jgi:predicted DNA-binding protein YlxM (UPF0122 family)|nr:hypothetical protein [Clostridiales bacterium]
MEYQELFNKYVYLLKDKENCHNKLALLKDGYISTKPISGKKYPYLQYRVDGKLLSEYIKDDSLLQVREELATRAALLEQIKEIDGQLRKLETAAAILDKSLSRKLITLGRCAIMEVMSLAEREKSLAFSSAMTALEGIPAGEDTEKNLALWARGETSFKESYLNTLRTHHLTEG